MSSKVKLTYFDLRGRAELIRLILLAGNIPFEDNRITFAQWPQVKPTTPTGQLPIVELTDGTVLNESLAIAGFFAAKCNLRPDNEMSAYRCHRAICTLEDFFLNFGAIFKAKTDEEKATLRKDLKENLAPKYLNTLKKYLKEAGDKFMAGDKLTVADLHLVNVTDHLDDADLTAYPELVQVRQKVLDTFPTIKKHREERPVTVL